MLFVVFVRLGYTWRLEADSRLHSVHRSLHVDNVKGHRGQLLHLVVVVHPQMGTMGITTYIYTHTHLTVVVCMRKLRYQLNIKPVTYI